MGVVFQFFQLLPTLTALENVRLPMDFCNLYTPAERNERAMQLLDLVGIAEHAHKLPNHLAGGQQQRAAIARALANDPPIIATDEPTGNLDSRTAEAVMQLFEDLVKQGKTILMVTHDEDLARRAPRTVVIHDGEIVNEYVAKALPMLSHELLLQATRQLETRTFAPGEPIIVQDAEPDEFFIITSGEAKVYLHRTAGDLRDLHGHHSRRSILRRNGVDSWRQTHGYRARGDPGGSDRAAPTGVPRSDRAIRRDARRTRTRGR